MQQEDGSTTNLLAIHPTYSLQESADSAKTTKKIVTAAVLLSICLISAAPAYCMDNLVPLQNILLEQMKLTELQYNAISSFYSLPNIIFVIFGGILVDKIGHRLSSIFFIIMILVGQFLVAFGVYKNLYALLMVGRVIFGVGSESLGVSTSKYTIVWFEGALLSPSFGIQVAFSRLTGFLNMLITPLLYNKFLERFPDLNKLSVMAIVLSIGVFYCIFGLILTIILSRIDKKYEYMLTTADSLISSENKFSIRDALKFSPTYWLLTAFCFVFYLPFGSYGAISPLYFLLKNQLEISKATKILSINSLFGMVFCVLFGVIVGKVGRDIVWMHMGSFICLVGHSVFSFTFISPYFIVIFRGLGSSIIACTLWSSIKYVVPPYAVGLAYGIIQSIQNLGLSISPLITALLVEKIGYFSLEIAAQMCFSLSLVVISLAMLLDKMYTNGILSMSTTQRMIYLAENAFGLLLNHESDNEL